MPDFPYNAATANGPIMTKTTRLLLLFPLLAASALVTTCGSENAPMCRVAAQYPLDKNALTLTLEGRLIRAGTRFVLATTSADGGQVLWATLSEDGVLGPVTTLDVPLHALGPYVGVAGKAAPGDQLLVVYAKPTPADPMNKLDLLLLVQDAGAASPPESAAKKLVEVPGGAAQTDLRVSLGTSKSGLVAAMAWGYEGQDAAPNLRVLGADGASVGADATLPTEGAVWRCLQVTSSRDSFGVTHYRETAPGAPPKWSISEFGDSGAMGATYNVQLIVSDPACPTMSPTPEGYVITHLDRANNNYWVVDYNVSSTMVDPDLFASQIDFGGAQNLPRAIAAVASMGNHNAVLFAWDTKAHVWRLSYDGKPDDARLALPTKQGSLGKVSAWSAPDTMFATYVDILDPSATTGNTSANQRYLIKISCPEQAN